jgi:hypothetical protein
LYRFRDLKELNIVRSRAALKYRVEHDGFPPGRLTSPHERTWTEEEIAEYLNRPRTCQPLIGWAKAQRARRLQREAKSVASPPPESS